ncbi:hypothetical protein GIB67_013211, partial [Kingdonia uniflora]
DFSIVKLHATCVRKLLFHIPNPLLLLHLRTWNKSLRTQVALLSSLLVVCSCSGIRVRVFVK